MTLNKRRTRLQQQHIGRLQPHLAKITLNPFTATADRQHCCPIKGSKVTIANTLANKLALI